MTLSDESSETKKSKRPVLLRRIEILFFLGLLWLFFILTGRALCKIAIFQISELTNTKITTSSVVFNLDGSVVIKGLKVRPEEKQTYDDTILTAKRVSIRFSLISVLLRNPQLKKITVKDFVLNVQQNIDTGQWNLSGVKIQLSKKDGDGKMPFVHLKGGTVQYSKISEGVGKTIAVVPIDAGFRSAQELIGGYSFDISTAQRADSDKSTLFGSWRPGTIEVWGSISSSDLPAFERKWWIDFINVKLTYDQTNAYSLQLKISDMQLEHTPVSEIPTFVIPPKKSLNSSNGT